jgi:hypothetical protein
MIPRRHSAVAVVRTFDNQFLAEDRTVYIYCCWTMHAVATDKRGIAERSCFYT